MSEKAFDKAMDQMDVILHDVIEATRQEFLQSLDALLFLDRRGRLMLQLGPREIYDSDGEAYATCIPLSGVVSAAAEVYRPVREEFVAQVQEREKIANGLRALAKLFEARASSKG